MDSEHPERSAAPAPDRLAPDWLTAVTGGGGSPVDLPGTAAAGHEATTERARS